MTLLFSLFKARFKGLLRLRQATLNTNFECLRDKCPRNCCKAFALVEVSANEATAGGFATRLVNGKCYLKREKGACIYLSTGSCTVYEHRPGACKEYPLYKIDGKHYVDIGCPGIREGTGPSNCVFSNIMEMKRYYVAWPRTQFRILVWMLTHW